MQVVKIKLSFKRKKQGASSDVTEWNFCFMQHNGVEENRRKVSMQNNLRRLKQENGGSYKIQENGKFAVMQEDRIKLLLFRKKFEPIML